MNKDRKATLFNVVNEATRQWSTMDVSPNGPGFYEFLVDALIAAGVVVPLWKEGEDLPTPRGSNLKVKVDEVRIRYKTIEPNGDIGFVDECIVVATEKENKEDSYE